MDLGIELLRVELDAWNTDTILILMYCSYTWLVGGVERPFMTYHE